MPRSCVINTDNVVTIPKNVLESRIVLLSSEKIEALDAALQYSLRLGGRQL